MSIDALLEERLGTVLRAGPRIRLALLFGSTARGEQRPDSHVDVAILPEDLAMTLAQELALQVELTRAFPRRLIADGGRPA